VSKSGLKKVLHVGTVNNLLNLVKRIYSNQIDPSLGLFD